MRKGPASWFKVASNLLANIQQNFSFHGQSVSQSVKQRTNAMTLTDQIHTRTLVWNIKNKIKRKSDRQQPKGMKRGKIRPEEMRGEQGETKYRLGRSERSLAISSVSNIMDFFSNFSSPKTFRRYIYIYRERERERERHRNEMKQKQNCQMIRIKVCTQHAV